MIGMIARLVGGGSICGFVAVDEAGMDIDSVCSGMLGGCKGKHILINRTHSVNVLLF